MRVKSQTARWFWRFGAKMNKVDPELLNAYLNGAEMWADKIEEVWDGDDASFNETARQAHALIMSEFEELQFHSKACDLLVDYLEETWEFGEKLRRWYGGSSYTNNAT